MNNLATEENRCDTCVAFMGTDEDRHSGNESDPELDWGYVCNNINHYKHQIQ